MKYLRWMAIASCGAGAVYGQVPPVVCNVSANPVAVRSNNATAQVADLVMVCSGGVPTAVGQTAQAINLSVTLNAEVTSRVLSSGTPVWPEALLILDEPVPNAQFPCDSPNGICPLLGNGAGSGYYGSGAGTPAVPQNRNVFQGQMPNANSIVFVGVGFDPPGPNGTRTFRIVNLKANITTANVPDGQIVAFLSIQNPPANVQLNNTTAAVGLVQSAFTSSVRDANNANQAPAGINVPYSAVATPARYSTLRFTEGFLSSFRTRSTAAFSTPDSSPPPVNQNTIGAVAASESGFYNSGFGTNGQRGNLGTAGLADTGTRLLATISNIPAGVSVFVDLYATSPANGVARLVTTDFAGAGPFNAAAGANNRAQLTVTNGAATAVWEVLRGDPQLTESFDAGVYLTMNPGASAPPPILVQTSLAPTAASASIPRFSPAGLSQTLFNFFLPQPLLQVTPASLSFIATAGAPLVAPQTLNISSPSGGGGAGVPFSITSTPSILWSFQPASGVSPSLVTVVPNIANLPPGVYTGTVFINSSQAPANPVVSIPATLTIRPAPRIDTLSPNSVVAGSAGFTLNVIGANFQPGVTVLWNGTGLPASVVNETLIIAQVPASLLTSPGPVQVAVMSIDGVISGRPPFTITAPPLFQVTPARLSFTATAGAPVAPQILNINSATALPFDVTSTRSIPWNFQPSAGTTPGFVVVTPNIGNLPPGSYNDTIFVNSSQAPGNPVVSVPVSLTIRPGPRIDTLSPSSTLAGSAGLAINIGGANLQPGSFVRWNDILLPSTTVSETLITAQVPAALLAFPGTAEVKVTTVDGAVSGPLTFTVMGQLRIESISPASVIAGDAGFPLTITGAGFLPNATVQVGGVALIPSTLLPSQIIVNVPAASISKPGPLPVSVTNPGSLLSNTVTLGVTAPTSVTLTSLNPDRVTARNAPLTVSIAGTGFVSGASVQFGNQTLAATTLSSTSLTVELPASRLTEAGTVAVTVTNPLGQTSNVLPFTILPALTLVSLSRTSTTAGAAAFSLELSGSGFLPEAVVRMGSATLPPTRVTPASITVTVPSAVVAREGTLAVTVVNPGNIASAALNFLVLPPAIISGLSPPSITAGGTAFTLTVNGANFVSGATVTWNGQPVPTAFVNSGQLTAQVPAALIAAAGPATVTVLDMNGAISPGVVVNVTLPALPPVTFIGASVSESNRDQQVTVTLGATYPVPLEGQLELVFTGDGGLPDDPMIQFSNGRRLLTFAIPAHTPPQILVTVKAGTVAGVIVLTPSFRAGPVNVTPVGVATQRITVARAAPVLTSVECTRPAASTFAITADGFTNLRSATQASFDFQAASGVTLGTNQLSLDAGSLFNAWFSGPAAAGVGGTFRYNQIFNVQGASSSIGAVSLRLTNAAGTSTAVTATCR